MHAYILTYIYACMYVLLQYANININTYIYIYILVQLSLDVGLQILMRALGHGLYACRVELR